MGCRQTAIVVHQQYVHAFIPLVRSARFCVGQLALQDTNVLLIAGHLPHTGHRDEVFAASITS